MFSELELMNWKVIESIVSIVGSVIAFVGVILVYRQISKLNISVQNDAQGRLYIQNGEVRSKLVEYPELRKYFFSNETITSASNDYDRVRTIAEMYLNWMEHLVLQEYHVDKKNWDAWSSIINDIYQTSPIIRDTINQKPRWYSDILHKIIIVE